MESDWLGELIFLHKYYALRFVNIEAKLLLLDRRLNTVRWNKSGVFSSGLLAQSGSMMVRYSKPMQLLNVACCYELMVDWNNSIWDSALKRGRLTPHFLF